MPEIFDSESEFALLGGLLKHAINALVAIEGYSLAPSDFASEDTQRIYYLIKVYLEKTSSDTIDPAILRLEAKSFNIELDNDLLDVLYSTTSSLKDLPQYAKVIKICSIGRKLVSRTNSFLSEAKHISAASKYGDICKLHDGFIRDTTDILANASHDSFKHIYDGVGKLLNDIISGKQEVGLIATNFPKLMAALGGSLRFSSLNVVSALDKVGKSPFCLTVAENVAAQGYPVLYIDTELEREYQACRLLSTRTGIPLSRIEYGSFINDPSDEKKVKDELEAGKALKIDHFPCAGYLLDDILQLIKRWIFSKAGRKPDGTANSCLVCYDYLKVSTSREYMTNISEYQILGVACTELHDLAKIYRIPIIMAAQLNKEGAIGASRRIDQLCSTRIVLQRKLPEELVIHGKYGNRKLSIARSRFKEPPPENEFIHVGMDSTNGKWTENEYHSKLMSQIGLDTKSVFNSNKKPKQKDVSHEEI